MTHDSRIIFGISFALILTLTVYATYPVTLPSLTTQWNMSATEAGWIAGSFFLGHTIAVASLPALTDRLAAKYIFLFSTIVTALASAGFALTAYDAWSASLWRLLQGFGLGGAYIPGLRALIDSVHPSSRDRAAAWYTSLYYIGASASYFGSGYLLKNYGWEFVFLVACIGPILGCLIGVLLLKTIWPQASQAHIKDNTQSMKSILFQRRTLGLTLGYSAHNAELLTFHSWSIAFLAFAFSVSNDASSTPLSPGALIALITIVAVPASVYTNSLIPKVPRSRILLYVTSLSLVVGIAFGWSAYLPEYAIILLTLLFMITIAADSAALTNGLISSTPPEHLGKVLAFYSASSYGASTIAPFFFGFLLDSYGGSQSLTAWGWSFVCFQICVYFLARLGAYLYRSEVQ